MAGLNRGCSLKKTAVLWGILASLLWLPAKAPAHLLQAAHVLDLMVKKLGRVERIEATHRVTVMEDRADREAMERIETVRYLLPGRYLSRLTAPFMERIHLYSFGRSVTVKDGEIIPGTGSITEQYPAIFLYRNRPDLVGRLTAEGVDLSVSSLGRLDEKIAFVLGARYPDDSAPQVWVDRESFLPIRWITGALSEVRFSGWRKVGKTWYPRRITFYSEGTQVRVLDVLDVDVDPEFSGGIFNVERLESEFAKGPEESAEPFGDAERAESFGDAERAESFGDAERAESFGDAERAESSGDADDPVIE